MSEAKLSPNLSGIVDFGKELCENLEKGNCENGLRESVSAKLEKLSELLLKLTAVLEMKAPNNEKSNMLSKILDGLELKEVKVELNSEVESTKKTLQSKMKKVATNMKEEIQERAEHIKQLFETNMSIVSDTITEAKKKEEALKKNSNTIESPNTDLEDKISKSDKEQVALEKVKPEGFFATFKRMWGERKNGEKKKGFFAVFKDAYTEVSLSKVEEESLDKKDELLYDEQLQTADQIKKGKANYNGLKREFQDVSREIVEVGKNTLDDCKDRLNKAIAPIKEKDITKDRLTNLIAKLESFSGKAKDWADNMRKIISSIDKDESRGIER